MMMTMQLTCVNDDADVESHLLKHSEPRHKCHYCSFATRQLQSLRIHERRIHTNDRPHLCEACGKSFVKSTLLKEHINGMTHAVTLITTM